MRRVLALALAGLIFAVPGHGPAWARPQDGPREGSGHVVTLPGTGRDWYGAYRVGERTGYCADLMSAPPRRAVAWTEAPDDAPVVKQTGLAAGSPLPHARGTEVVAPADLAQIAWVLTSTGPEPTPDTAAAVEHLVRLRTVGDEAQRRRENDRWSTVVATHRSAASAFERLSVGAERLAGPYRVTVEWRRRPQLAAATGEADVSVWSAAGLRVPHVALSARETGALSVTHAPATTGADGVARIAVSVTAPAASPVKGDLTVTAHGLSGSRPRVLIPTPATVQRMLVAPATTTASATLAAVLEPHFSPTLTTRTRDPLAVVGEPAVDLVVLTGGRPGARFRGHTTLHGPFATLAELAAATPEGAPRVGDAEFSGTYGADGAAEVSTDESVVYPEEGYYTWTEHLAPAPYVTPPSPAAWPQTAETSLVVAPAVTTHLTPQGTAVAGAEVSDALRVTGIPGVEVPGQGPLSATADGRLLGPLPPRPGRSGVSCSDLDWSAAAVVASYEGIDLVQASLRAHGLAAAAPDEPGCYSAEAVLTVTHASRSPITVHHSAGLPAQTVLLEAPAAPEASPSPSPTPAPLPTPEVSPGPHASPTPEPSPTPVLSPTPEASSPASRPRSTVRITASTPTAPGLPSTGH